MSTSHILVFFGAAALRRGKDKAANKTHERC